MGIAQEQAISLLTNTRNGNNTLIDSFIIRERASPLYVVMAVNGSDSPATLILRLFFFESTRAYVLEFTLGNKPAKVKELIDYIGTSFTYHDTPHSIRLRSDSLVFIGTSSSFNWFSDIENGLILSGQVLETPSFLQVKRDDEKSGTSINAIDKNNVIDTNPLFFMVNNRRVWPIVQSPEIGTHLAIYKAEFALPIEESSVSYTISCTIPSQSTQIDRTIIFQSEAVQTLLKRELFFPVYQDNNDAGGEGDR